MGEEGEKKVPDEGPQTALCPFNTTMFTMLTLHMCANA